MKTIKTHRIILFMIVLVMGLSAVSCEQPTGDQTQIQEEAPAAEFATTFDAMVRFPGFDTKDRKCTDAAVDIFLKLEGIPGESEDAEHEGEIDVLSWSWGASTRGTGSHAKGSGAAKVEFQDLNITKHADKASPELRRLAASGEPIPEAALTLRTTCGDKQEFFEIQLEDVLISAINTGPSVGSSRRIPTESISFNYSKIALLLPAVQSVPSEPAPPPRDDE